MTTIAILSQPFHNRSHESMILSELGSCFKIIYFSTSIQEEKNEALLWLLPSLCLMSTCISNSSLWFSMFSVLKITGTEALSCTPWARPLELDRVDERWEGQRAGTGLQLTAQQVVLIANQQWKPQSSILLFEWGVPPDILNILLWTTLTLIILWNYIVQSSLLGFILVITLLASRKIGKNTFPLHGC